MSRFLFALLACFSIIGASIAMMTGFNEIAQTYALYALVAIALAVLANAYRK